MRLIVTRPPAQAAAWVAQLQALGLDAVALPLIGIAPVTDGALLQRAWAALGSYALVLFVSPNAVQQFFTWRGQAAWPAQALAASTGPGTTAALREAGVAPDCIAEPAADAPSFDTEALWARLSSRDWRGQRVLIVRGEEGRDWFAETMRRHGAEVEFVAAYRRLAPQPDAASAALIAAALAAPQRHLWLFSSSEAIGHLVGMAPAADWSASRAAASHPRIVHRALAAGFGRVDAVAPTPAAVADLLMPPSIQSAPL
jgi:uroporphyrinogen-III synthase